MSIKGVYDKLIIIVFFFFRYFTLFMNLLNDCNEAECTGIEENPRQRAGKPNTLRNATIQAMSNLLSANIDSGLMHSIGILFFLLRHSLTDYE